MKNMKLFLVALIGILTVGCYNDFDTPAPQKIYTDNDLTLMGLEHKTIKQIKDEFATQFGSISGTGNNASWGDTKTLKFGEANSAETESTFQGMKFWSAASNYYIKGKVISSDEQGNIYKSLYIWDGTAGIELKLTNDLFLTYKLNLQTKESQWVYVRLKDLYLGNYRMMLSIGSFPTSGYNVAGLQKFYANSNLIDPKRVRRTVLPGERVQLTEGPAFTDDIRVVDNTSYSVLSPADFSRLVRFKGVKVHYAGVTYYNEQRDASGNIVYEKNEKNEDILDKPIWNPNPITAPAVMNGTNSNPLPSWIVTDERIPQFGAWYKWAFSDFRKNIKLYGSILMTYLDEPKFTSDKGVYSIRTSGYSQFADGAVVRNHTEGDVLGIYAIYSKDSNFSGGAGDYAQYQISVSRFEDLGFRKDAVLTAAWLKKNTPEASYSPPVKNGYEE